MKQIPFAAFLFTWKLEIFRIAFPVIFVLIIGAATGVRAATFTVTKTADTNDGVCNADCSLREAIGAVNAASTPDNFISFDPAVFSTPQTIVPGFGSFLITTNGTLVIDGPGTNLLALDGVNFIRVFLIQGGGDVSINNLTIKRGKGGSGGIICSDRGGAICNNGGNLVLNNIIFNENQAPSSSGAILNNGGRLVVNNSTFTNNQALAGATNGDGGAIDNLNGELTVTGSTFDNNSAANGNGGAIRHSSAAPLTITNSTFNNNRASHAGGAVFNSSGTLTISSTVFTSNQTTELSAVGGGGGGAIHNDTGEMTITGVTINGNRSAFAGGIYNAANVQSSLTNLTVTGNTAFNGTGGGLLSTGPLNVTGAEFSGNTAAATTNFDGGIGGGIFSSNTLMLSGVTIRNNSATSCAGLQNNRGNVDLINSTVNDNTALNIGGGICLGTSDGGGYTANITNSTITGNTANDAGGLSNGITTSLTNVTINANRAGRSAGGVSNNGTGVINAHNTIIGNNLLNTGVPSDYQGSLVSLGYNLIGNTGGATITGNTTGNITGQDPQLIVLRDNGGPTLTVALQPTSPAIDAGDPVSFPAADQRGIVRSQDGDINGSSLPDIGAYERLVSTFTVTKTADTNDGACNADCSLREAIAAANLEANRDSAVIFSPEVFSTSQTIILTGGALNAPLNKTLAIYGTGANLLTISGNNQSRVFGTASSLLLSGLRITGGRALQTETSSGDGGGIFNGDGFLAVVDSVITGNSADGSGGGIYSGFNNSSARLRLVNTAVDQNSSGHEGGGVLCFGKSSEFINSVISSNTGEGIYIFGISTFIFTNSKAQANSGTGIHLDSGVTGIIAGSSISENRSGGIFNSGTLTVSNSLINGNTGASQGGGISNEIDGFLTIGNSTISGNSATSLGGGIYNRISSTVTITGSTITRNRTAGIGGGVLNSSSGTVNVRSSIIAGNSAVIQSPDFDRALTSQGYNLIGNTSGTTISGTTTGNILNVDPRLDPVLRENFGSTKTHALRIGSPALDKGPVGLTADQRGFTRPFDFPSIPNASGGNGSDIGAFERQAADIVRTGTPFDFDGDGLTDISIFRPDPGEWWYSRSSDGQVPAAQFGTGADKPTPADFTGDGRTDIAFWRPSTGEWFILRSEDISFYSFPFGASGDIPAVGDFDGDGKADATIFRPSTGEWFVLKSSGGVDIITFGTTGDVPVPSDYDGDGKTDIAIWRPSDGSWWYIRSSDQQSRVYRFGVSTDKPVQGDYTGDGKADIAIFRPATGEWFVQRSEDNSFYSVPFGTNGDLPVPGDYDGDGKFDTAVFRPAGATWFVNRSTAGILITTFGISGDVPAPSVFIY